MRRCGRRRACEYRRSVSHALKERTRKKAAQHEAESVWKTTEGRASKREGHEYDLSVEQAGTLRITQNRMGDLPVVTGRMSASRENGEALHGKRPGLA